MAVSQQSTSVIKMTAQGDEVTEKNLAVNYLYWISPSATAGHTLLVTDSAGNEIYADVADGANYKQLYPIKNNIDGIKIQTMQSGTLYVIKAPRRPGNW
ncbi:MAG: hypothetical protein ACUVWN_16655 [bacterium]